ncbi:MAG: alpha amylase C-terminal domain-containing protein [Planctomycetes bacterium]|nr:alpha amylase C-terminal domain-containing protein [Planctomycetota bacterium]
MTPPAPAPAPLAASSRPGEGSIPYPGGTTFRVWAPFADSVSVMGEFNGWSMTSHPLVGENNGWWSVDVPGAAAGQRYRYWITNQGNSFSRMDPYARQVTNSVGDSVIYDRDAFDWGSAGFTTPPWHEMVVYEMHIGQFNDQPGGGPGTFAGAIDKLNHVRDLGINVIELMPVAEFAGDHSWGYNTAHPFAVESAYGGPTAFKQFVKEAHARGIAVLVDVVYNHFGPTDLPMWRFDGWNQWGLGGIYFYNDWRGATMWGYTRPDYGRSEVRRYLRDNAMMYLEEYRLDGLRWDSTINIRTQSFGSGDIPEGWHLMKWINDEINWAQSWKISVAEDMSGNEWITKPTSVGGAGFDAQWDPEFVHPIRYVVTPPNDADRNMWTVQHSLYHNFNGDGMQRVIYTESHDETANGRQRLPEDIWPGNADSWFSKKRSTLSAALVMTAPGIPLIFQGQEFLEDGWFHLDGDDPLDWNRRNAFAGIVTLYRDLIRLRRNWNNTTRGLRGRNINVHHVNNWEKMIAFHRWDQGGRGDDVVIVANFADRTFTNYNVGFPRGGMWRVRFNSDWSGYSGDFGNTLGYDTEAQWGSKDGMAFNGNVGVGPYSVVVFSQDP